MRHFFLTVVLLFKLSVVAEQLDYVDEPLGCLEKMTRPCSTRFLKNGIQTQTKDIMIVGKKGSNIFFGENGVIQILSGQFYLNTLKKVNINSGVIKIFSRGELWISKSQKNRTEIKNLNGDVKVSNALFQEDQELPIGYENWYDGIMQNAMVKQGVVQPINSNKFLSLWNKTTLFDRSKSKMMINNYKKLWEGNIQSSADLYEKEVSRGLAQVEEREKKSYQKYLKEKEERQKLKDLFRKKNFVDLVE